MVAVLLVIIGVGVMVYAVSAVELPGTVEPEPDEPRFDLEASVGVEGTLTGAQINANTFDSTVECSGLFSFSLTGGNLLAVTGADDVEIEWVLNSPALDSSVRHTEQLGELGSLDSMRPTFTANNLPAGEYTLEITLLWNDGTDRMTQTLQINEASAVNC